MGDWVWSFALRCRTCWLLFSLLEGPSSQFSSLMSKLKADFFVDVYESGTALMFAQGYGARFLFENFQLIYIKEEQDTSPMLHSSNNKQKMTQKTKCSFETMGKETIIINQFSVKVFLNYFFFVCVQQNAWLEAKVPLHAQESGTKITPYCFYPQQ